MATTAGGTYYAASSELVSSWPATSLNLANQLESRFAAKAPTASPTFTGTLTATASTNRGFGLDHISTGTFSGAGAISLGSLFSATWMNYQLRLWFTASATSSVGARIQMLSGATPATTNYFGVYNLSTNAAGPTRTYTSAASACLWGYVGSSQGAAVINIFRPAIADHTTFQFDAITQSAGDYSEIKGSGKHTTATAYDGVYLYPDSGTWTGGWSMYGFHA